MRFLGSTCTPIGVEVSGRYINAAQLRTSSRRPRLEAGISIRRQDPEVPVDPSEIAVLASALDRQGFRGRAVVAAVPLEQVVMDVVELPKGKQDRHCGNAVRAELAKRHKWATQGFELASWEIPTGGHRDRARRMMAVGCPHQAANPFLDAFESAGLEVRALDLPSWALARMVTPLTVNDEQLCGVVSLGWSHASLIVLDQGVVVYVRALGGVSLNRLHLGLCSRLDLEADISQHIVHDIGLDQPAEGDAPRLHTARRQLSTFAGQLATELSRSLSYVLQEFPDTPMGRIYLVGEGAGINGLDRHLTTVLRLETKPLVPADVVDHAPSLGRRCHEPLLSTAVGLASW